MAEKTYSQQVSPYLSPVADLSNQMSVSGTEKVNQEKINQKETKRRLSGITNQRNVLEHEANQDVSH